MRGRPRLSENIHDVVLSLFRYQHSPSGDSKGLTKPIHKPTSSVRKPLAYRSPTSPAFKPVSARDQFNAALNLKAVSSASSSNANVRELPTKRFPKIAAKPNPDEASADVGVVVKTFEDLRLEKMQEQARLEALRRKEQEAEARIKEAQLELQRRELALKQAREDREKAKLEAEEARRKAEERKIWMEAEAKRLAAEREAKAREEAVKAKAEALARQQALKNANNLLSQEQRRMELERLHRNNIVAQSQEQARKFAQRDYVNFREIFRHPTHGLTEIIETIGDYLTLLEDSLQLKVHGLQQNITEYESATVLNHKIPKQTSNVPETRRHLESSFLSCRKDWSRYMYFAEARQTLRRELAVYGLRGHDVRLLMNWLRFQMPRYPDCWSYERRRLFALQINMLSTGDREMADAIALGVPQPEPVLKAGRLINHCARLLHVPLGLRAYEWTKPPTAIIEYYSASFRGICRQVAKLKQETDQLHALSSRNHFQEIIDVCAVGAAPVHEHERFYVMRRLHYYRATCYALLRDVDDVLDLIRYSRKDRRHIARFWGRLIDFRHNLGLDDLELMLRILEETVYSRTVAQAAKGKLTGRTPFLKAYIEQLTSKPKSLVERRDLPNILLSLWSAAEEKTKKTLLRKRERAQRRGDGPKIAAENAPGPETMQEPGITSTSPEEQYHVTKETSSELNILDPILPARVESRGSPELETGPTMAEPSRTAQDFEDNVDMREAGPDTLDGSLFDTTSLDYSAMEMRHLAEHLPCTPEDGDADNEMELNGFDVGVKHVANTSKDEAAQVSVLKSATEDNENDDFNSTEQNLPALTFQISEQKLRDAMRASLSSTAAYWTHRLYENPEGKKVTVHYCTTKQQSEDCALKLADEPILGFDLEWSPLAKAGRAIKQNISLIQLASETRIAMFHIARHAGESPDEFLSPTLKSILSSPRILKCGVNVAGDRSRIMRYLGIDDAQGYFELSHLYKLVNYGHTEPRLIDKKPVSLKTQVETTLQLPLSKGEVRSNWGTFQSLTYEQQTYAAADAYAGFRLFHALEARRLEMVPRPPRPALYELKEPIRARVRKITSRSLEESPLLVRRVGQQATKHKTLKKVLPTGKRRLSRAVKSEGLDADGEQGSTKRMVKVNLKAKDESVPEHGV